MATASFIHDGRSIDYTPGSDVSAGDVVVQGELVGIEFESDSLGTDFDALHERIRKRVRDDAGPGSAGPPEVILKCAYDLKYKYTMAAVTAVTGYEADDKTIVKIVDQIKFSPLQEGGSSGL